MLGCGTLGYSLYDATGNGHDGTNYGTTTVTEGGRKVRNFDGSNDYVRVAHHADFNVNEHTLSYCAKFYDQAATGMVVDKYEGDQRGFYNTVYPTASNNNLAHKTYAPQDTQQIVESTFSPFSGDYLHYAGSKDSDSVQIYVNGAQEDTENVTAALSANAGDLSIGARYYTADLYTHMRMEELRLSSVARSAAWIKAESHDLKEMDLITIIPVDTYKVTIDHTKVDAAVTNFPVRVCLDEHGIPLDADPTIYHFTDEGNNELKFERAYYNTSENKAVFYVKVPFISDIQDTNMYIKTDAVSDMEDAANVWDADFKGVWHLNDSLNDSTSNANHGTNYNTTLVDGLNGKARQFDGSIATRIECATLDITGAANRTAMAVVKHTNPSNGGVYISTGTLDGAGTKWMLRANHNEPYGTLRTEIQNGNYVANEVVPANQRTAVTTKYDGITQSQDTEQYIDGVKNTKDTSTVNNTINTINGSLLFGSNKNTNNDKGLSGIIEEVRISDIARSDAWIALETHDLVDQDLITVTAIISAVEYIGPYYLIQDDSKIKSYDATALATVADPLPSTLAEMVQLFLDEGIGFPPPNAVLQACVDDQPILKYYYNRNDNTDEDLNGLNFKLTQNYVPVDVLINQTNAWPINGITDVECTYVDPNDAIRFIFSVDEGVTWYSYDTGTTFNQVAPDIVNVLAAGNTPAELIAIPESAWDALIDWGGTPATSIRFAFTLDFDASVSYLRVNYKEGL